MAVMEEKMDILKNFGKENPFSVPENYFEDFAQNIQRRIKEEEPSKKTVTMSRIAIVFSAAATLAIALFAAGAIFRTKSPSGNGLQQNIAAAEYDETESDTWIAYLDESTQIEYFVSNFENDDTDF
jgi:hypothetical protein